MKLSVKQALVLAQAEIAKCDGPIKNTANRQVNQLLINIGKPGIEGVEVVSLPEPPPRSGRRSKKQSAPKGARRSASSTTGRRD